MKMRDHLHTFQKMNGLKTRKISLLRYLIGKIRHIFCQFGIHKGNVILEGYIQLGEKKNKPKSISKDIWKIRFCDFCGELFSKPEDCEK